MAKRDQVEAGSSIPKRLSYRSFRRRAIYSFLLIFLVLFIGTLAFHYIEGYSYINSFYFVSMLATAQGPANTPATTLGKIVASALAFISVGAVIVALGFLFGPFIGKVLRMEERGMKEEERKVSSDIKKLISEL